MDDTFFDRIPVYYDFNEITNQSHYIPIPKDWFVVVADVVNSTQAIENGQYKAVNTLGASIIIAIQNAIKPTQIPYVFGGDGASLCIPKKYIDIIKDVLIATKQMAINSFALNLRIGIVPLSIIRKNNFNVLVMNFQPSEYITQTMFAGGGISFADKLIKDTDKNNEYLIHDIHSNVSANFTGLECRWDTIPSRHGEIISILIKSFSKNQNEIYRSCIGKIQEIYDDTQNAHPIAQAQLHLSLKRSILGYETKVQNACKGFFFNLSYAIQIRLENILGNILIHFGFQFAGVDWSKYKSDLITNTDYKKFDDMLRFVLSGTKEQRLVLTQFLEKLHQKGELSFGINSSASAIITCIVFDRNGKHLHFVDGAEGGYTMAAKALKKQMKS